MDLDNLVQPLLFRILCSYLDHGISIWKFPMDQGGFLASLQSLEKESYPSIFTPREKDWLLNKPLNKGGCHQCMALGYRRPVFHNTFRSFIE